MLRDATTGYGMVMFACFGSERDLVVAMTPPKKEVACLPNVFDCVMIRLLARPDGLSAPGLDRE